MSFNKLFIFFIGATLSYSTWAMRTEIRTDISPSKKDEPLLWLDPSSSSEGLESPSKELGGTTSPKPKKTIFSKRHHYPRQVESDIAETLDIAFTVARLQDHTQANEELIKKNRACMLLLMQALHPRTSALEQLKLMRQARQGFEECKRTYEDLIEDSGRIAVQRHAEPCGLFDSKPITPPKSLLETHSDCV